MDETRRYRAAQVAALKDAGHSFRDIAAMPNIGIGKSQAQRDYRWWQEQQLFAKPVVKVETYPFGGMHVSGQVPVFNTALHYEGDCIVVGDVHVPTTDWEFTARVAQVAENWLPPGNRVLCIVGDLINADAMSKYDHIVPPISIDDELKAARALIQHWLTVFDRIYYGMGNHEFRILKDGWGTLLFELLGDARLTVSKYTHMTVESGGIHWLLTHQRNYSRIKGRVADQLALKFQTNVITHHEHHVAIQRDTYNHYTIVNNGTLADPEKLAYVQLVQSTSAEMCQGFTLLHSGTAHLLTPYETFTNWSHWLPPRQAKQQGKGKAA